MNKEKEHNCNCNHDHEGHQHEDCGCHDHEGDCCNHDHQHDTITLTLDNDVVLECVVLGVFDVEDKEYIALLPQEEDNVLLYGYAASNDDEVELINIEDDDEYELVSKTFMSLIEEDIEDDSEEE